MEAFNTFLKQFPHYKPDVGQSAIQYLARKTLNPGDFFLQEGQVSRTIGFVEQGLLRMYYLNDGKEITKCFCRENTLTCSYQSLITQKPSDTSIQAIEPTEMITLSYDSLQKLYTKDLFWQQVGRLMAESEFVNTECHNRFLTDLSATDKYLQILETEGDLLQRVPLNYLASYLQIAPETLSRIRKKITRT